MTKHSLRHEGARPTTVKCPECGDVIVYNGNFFCNSFDALVVEKGEVYKDPGMCDWALPHPSISKKDRTIIDQLYQKGFIKELDYN